MLKVERAIAFTLPDGSYIKVETTGTGREGAEAGPDDWSALDVTLVRTKANRFCAALSTMTRRA